MCHGRVSSATTRLLTSHSLTERCSSKAPSQKTSFVSDVAIILFVFLFLRGFSNGYASLSSPHRGLVKPCCLMSVRSTQNQPGHVFRSHLWVQANFEEPISKAAVVSKAATTKIFWGCIDVSRYLT